MATDPEVSEPLGEADFEEIKRRLADLDRADSAIDKAIRAGIPIGDAKKQSADLRMQLVQLKNAYFPGRI